MKVFPIYFWLNWSTKCSKRLRHSILYYTIDCWYIGPEFNQFSKRKLVSSSSSERPGVPIWTEKRIRNSFFSHWKIFVVLRSFDSFSKWRNIETHTINVWNSPISRALAIVEREYKSSSRIFLSSSRRNPEPENHQFLCVVTTESMERRCICDVNSPTNKSIHLEHISKSNWFDKAFGLETAYEWYELSMYDKSFRIFLVRVCAVAVACYDVLVWVVCGLVCVSVLPTCTG